jgi:glycosyltransferase involved in cell wall biosynthesis
MEISVTVIIPTYNGAKKIAVLLNALLKQTLRPANVIVVIDGSTDNTLEIVKEFQSQISGLSVILQHNRGRSFARNEGARSTQNELLIFFDDDVEPESHCIERHLNFHQSAQMDCLVSGNIKEMVSASNTDIQNYKALLSQKWVEVFPPGWTRLDLNSLFFTSANCSVKNTVFQKLKMFDERLLDAEDHDIAYRALERGVLVFFDKENEVAHHERITCRSYVMRLRSYRSAHIKLKEFYPERLDYRIASSPNVLKKLAYRLFAQPIFVKWIDENNLIFFPQRLRYRIYDIVIHSLANIFPNIQV